MTVCDIHTHRAAPYPEGVISLRDFDIPLMDNQLYSAGIHPWDTAEEISEETFAKLENLARENQVALIGECGVDPNKGAPMYRQLQILKRQIDLSEKVEKPLILHCVKSADIILGLKRDLGPRQPWIIHGFRGKPELAKQLTDKGIYLSFGEKFNPAAVKAMPDSLILAETDESSRSIMEIIDSISEAAGRNLCGPITANATSLISGH